MKRVKTILEFEKLLQDHDWYYALSDDKRYYVANKTAEERIAQISMANSYWRELFLLYSEFSSPAERLTEEMFMTRRKQLMENYLASIGN